MGMGYRRAMSTTTSQRPVAVSGLIKAVMTAAIVVCNRAVEQGVNALDTSRRSRWCSAPSRLSRPFVTLSHSRPEVMPWASSASPFGTINRLSRNTLRTKW